MTTTEIIITESHELHLLTAQMQRHVDRTLAADRKGGEALWEKALAVADARAEATKGGDWGAFLQATGQHERAARRLVAIADRGRKEERFRTAIISGWLTFSVGAIAAQADDELLTNLLEQPTPPTRAQLTARPDTGVRSQLTAQPDTGVGSESVALRAGSGNDAPLTDAELVDLSWLGGWEVQSERTSPAGLPLITMAVMRGEHWGETREERTPGGWRIERDALQAEAEAKAEAKAVPTAPALSAFPPGHVEAGIGMLERRLREGTTQLAEDMQWAATFRTQLDAAREGMQPEVYGTWSARLYAVRDALIKLKDVCADCGTPTFLLMKSVEGHLIKLCEKCTTNRGFTFVPAMLSPVNRARRLGGSLDELKAPKRSGVPDSYVLRLPGQPDQEFFIAKHQPDRALVNAIEKIALWEQTAVNADIEAPQAAPVKKSTPPSQDILLQHAESMLADVIEAIPDTAITLVAALVCWEYEPYSGDDPREALFQTLKILAKDNLDVVETAIEKGRS